MTDDDLFVFEPDLELEWAVGPDVEVVFEPEGRVTPAEGSVAEWLLILAAFAVCAKGMVGWTRRPSCPMCGGRREHSKDCSWR